MKECYFCHNEIPKDAIICPMCGSDLSTVEEYKPSPNPSKEEPRYTQESFPREKSGTRRKKSSFKLNLLWQASIHYLAFNLKRSIDPIQNESEFEKSPIFGYVNIVLASILSSVILARIVSAIENSYQLLSQISILPNLIFQFNLFEWIWKLSIIFILFFLFFPIILYIFKRITKKESFIFHNTITPFVGMNSFTYLLLWIGLIMNLIAPLAMALPAILLIFIHSLSYFVSFVSATHLYFTQQGNSISKSFQWSLFGVSIHSILLSTIAYIFIKL
ncbi:hypothetical protein LZ578_05325 [Jeotgalibaca sp. MA1X17-3]|uniref:hypothetical protein n=1 Tax=Jeotgalibaca sp. MA1X17-3 TaxID=2908211 RepID=UPI001F1E8D4A|nr:hypothetical protein [Jeotgalibaca sp. MA1X17-3]UJF16525.1 hypothetical protein LZ578_05325 [Jeotgalibaca sp. MA1X17-3]